MDFKIGLLQTFLSSKFKIRDGRASKGLMINLTMSYTQKVLITLKYVLKRFVELKLILILIETNTKTFWILFFCICKTNTTLIVDKTQYSIYSIFYSLLYTVNLNQIELVYKSCTVD